MAEPQEPAAVELEALSTTISCCWLRSTSHSATTRAEGVEVCQEELLGEEFQKFICFIFLSVYVHYFSAPGDS